MKKHAIIPSHRSSHRSSHRALPALALGFGLLGAAACDLGSSTPVRVPDELPTPRTPVDPATLPQSAYTPAAEGFVVHEWGTLTSVVGSDGTLLPGLHHEEEDLPSFVSDRLAHARNNPAMVLDPTQQKMETPVTYFYAPTGRTVTAKVGFPSGMLTQWYPSVRDTWPPVYKMDGQLVDRYSQALEDIPDLCQPHFAGPMYGGMLDWGKVEVLAPGGEASLPPSPGKSNWGFARRTGSNPLRVAATEGTQDEKFLFYRGLGNFALPLQVAFSGQEPQLRSTLPAGQGTLGGVVLMVVTDTAAGFVELGDLPAGGQLAAALPTADLPHGTFVARLKERLARRLIADGLYTDEALAMVDTWERSYFLTPGVRLLYLLPQSHTERIIPLTITPAPEILRRTMVIRVELMTPAYERTLLGWLAQLGGANEGERAAARGRFLSLGRFAEPHLTRTAALAGDRALQAAADTLLREIRAHRRWAPTAAE